MSGGTENGRSDECERRSALITAYLDGELDLSGSLELERHLAQCPTCAQTLAAQQALGRAIAAADLRHRPPPELRRRLHRALQATATAGPSGAAADAADSAAVQNESSAPTTPLLNSAAAVPPGTWAGTWPPAGSRPPSKPSTSRVRRLQPRLQAIAALLLVAVSSWCLGRWVPGRPAGEPFAEELVASHIRSLLAARPADVASSDRHTVKPWFANKLDYSPTVLDLSAQGFPLLGGRLDYIGQRPVATLVYGAGHHTIDLSIWPTSSAPASEPAGAGSQPQHRRGYHLLHWSQGGMTYWAVSDLATASLQEFERRLSAELVREGG